MKKNLRYFMTLLLMMVASVGWAETATFSWEGSTTDTKTEPWSVSNNNVTIAFNKGTNQNTPSPNKEGSVRMYTGTVMTITAPNNYNITKVIFTPTSTTYSATNLTYGGSSLTNDEWNLTTPVNSVELTATANARFKTIVVTYTASGGGEIPTLEASDLALNPTTLEFDLYNNSSAQTVSFTTSSTGAVTVSGSEYVTTSISGNTITVTPLKVTPSPQTITVNQAADDTYQAGTVTFTVSIDDSTPSSDVWVETSLADLSASDVFVIVGNNGNNYAMSNDKGTASAPSAVAVTVAEGKITSKVSDNIKWTVSGNATDGYTFYPNGSKETWLYCTNSNNGVRVGTNNSKTFTIDGDYLKHVGTSRYVGIYNSQDWRCYDNTNGNISGQNFNFYKKQSASAPSINAEDFNLAYDATSGEIAYTITNPVPETSLTAIVSDGNWLTLGTVSETSIPFTCTANEGAKRTATVTLTYGGSTKTVTITQAAAPVVYTTIPAIFEAATSSEQEVHVTFNNWFVSGISTNGKNVFVTDNEGHGFVIFSSNDQSGIYHVGDVLSGTSVSCKLVLYNGFAEITELNATDLTITSGGSVSASSIALADLTGVNTGALVSYENLTCSIDGSNYYLSDGTTTIQVYNSLYNFSTSLVAGKKYNITGIYQQYSNKKEILPRSAEDIIELSLPPIDDHATLPFVFEGEFSNIANTAGLTQEGLGSYSSSPKLKFDGTGDYLILKINEAPRVLTFDIKGNSFSGGTFKVQESADGNTWTDLQTYTELGDTQSETFDNLSNDTRYIKWIYVNKASGNVALGNIYAGEPESISINEYGKATYVTTNALNFTGITTVTAYVATAQNGSDVTFDPVTKVPAGTPLLVKGTKNATVDVPVIASASATAPKKNFLVAGPVASLASTTTEEGTTYYNFILNAVNNEVGFYKANGKAVAANRAYLKLSDNPFTSPEGGAKVNLIFSDEETTGINNVNAVENTNEKVFNLAGQQMKSAVKGVYIKNGKKYVK